MNKLSLGITLIELLISIGIFSISMMLVMPSLNNFTAKNRISTNVTTLARAIQMARQSAVIFNKVTTLCRSNDHQHCQGKWQEGMILFIDHNQDHIFNGDDIFLTKFEKFPDEDTIYWRAFQNKQYLQMSPLGY
ncbi:MAG: hypothetical protein GY829_07325, partial [Gammaproteobacteria bacterium]|nr:hypothetical protein [Gammaproteobacteria bacterium]